MTKRFLISVMVFAGLGLPAGADILTYCAGSGCGAENESAFNTDLATDSYTLGGLLTFSATNLTGSTYTDPGTDVLFTDFLGQNFSVGSPTGVSPTGLSTPVAPQGSNYIVITIPATIAAIEFTVNIPGGVCLDAACPAGQTSGFVGFLNNTPGSQWTVEMGPLSLNQYVSISNFSVADMSGGPGGGGGDSDTPEVATMILIGFGLIAMRLMRRLPERLIRHFQPA
jgi:hypothetical protein